MGTRSFKTRLDQLEAKLRPFLSEEAELCLFILPFELRWLGETVHHNPVKEASLPFRLYSEGLRSLTLQEELTREGLIELLGVFNTDFSRDEMAEDDIVTILWERDIPGVSYELSEDTVQDSTGPSLGEFLGDGGGEEGQEMTGDAGAEPVEIPDSEELDRPDALPTESVSLSEEEAELLDWQLHVDAERDLLLEVPGIMFETIHLSPPDPAETTRLVEVICRMIDSMLQNAPAHRTQALLSKTFELIETVFADSEAVSPLRDGLLSHLSTIESARALGNLAEGLPIGTIAELQSILDRLPVEAGPSLAYAAAEAKRASVRRFFLEAVAKRGDTCVEVMSELIAKGRGPVALDLLSTLASIKSPAVTPVLERATGHIEPLVRRNAIKLLMQNPPEGVCDRLVKLLADSDRRVSVAALAAISTLRGAHEMQTLKKLIDASSFEERSEGERRTLLVAFAAVAQAEGVPALSKIMLQKGFFTRAARVADSVSAVEALSKVEDPSATAALEQGVKQGSKQVAEACRAQLGRRERSRKR